MLRVPTNLNYIKRTIKPLYANTQATPQNMLLDPAWNSSVDIYPGMALMRTTGQNVSLINAVGQPFGLSGFYEAPVLGIKQISSTGVNACPVWVLGPDAQFQIAAPAFDTTQTWADPGDGTSVLVHASPSGANRGQLVPSGAATKTALPIARLIQIQSTTSLIIGGLQPRTA